MKTLNKLLQRQINKYLGTLEDIPESFLSFLEVINETYVHQEKDRKMLERLIEISSEEMKELNHQLREESTQIKKSENKFRALIEKNAEIMTLTLPQGELLYASPSLTNILGYSFEEYKSKPSTEYIHPEDVSSFIEQLMILTGKPGASIFIQHRLLHKKGTYIWCEGTITNMLHDPYVEALVSNFRDISKRKQAEEKTIHANRLYAFISQINQTIVHAPDAQTVFNEVCRIAIECGKFKVAWIGMIDVANKKISLSAQCGFQSEDVAQFSDFHYEEPGATAHIVQTGSHFICNDVENEFPLMKWRAYGTSRNFKSSMALPIKKEGVVVGAFYLFSEEKNYFNAEEIALLEEATNDISFALDIFEKEHQRKLFEEKLTHNELRLKQGQKIAHFGSWSLDFSTGIAQWSDETCRIYGLPPNEDTHTYESWIAYTHPDDLDYVLTCIKESQANLSSSSFHHRIVRKDGSIRHVHSQAEFEFKDDKPIGLYGVVHDITDTKEAALKLLKSQDNLRLIVDLIPQSIIAMDANGKFVFVNKNFAALYGLTPEELVNKTVYETIPKNNIPDAFVEEAREVIKSGNSKIIPEMVFTDYLGVSRTFYSIKVPFDLAGENEKAMLGISLDITEQKKAETERSKMVADIVQHNKDLEQFSYIVSHNLRLPVANIIGLAELMQISNPSAEESETMIDQLLTSVKKLDDIIKDLNQILQVKHQVREKKELIKLSSICTDVQLSIDNLLKSEGVKITCDFSAIDEIFTLKSYLNSIFFNLISNSIKYRQTGIRPIIEISSRLVGNTIELTFNDNGLGIDLQKKGDQIFGMYKRFHYHTEGKGMGLYMVKTQVETLGGKIKVESELGKGTKFKIVFENNKV
jgi:PAS domain S-box-containing protein